MMAAMNIVRMRVKPEREAEWLRFHRERDIGDFEGMTSLRVIRIGEHEYMVLGEWISMEALAATRPTMIAALDDFRDMLEELAEGGTVTDPHSGEVVIERLP